MSLTVLDQWCLLKYHSECYLFWSYLCYTWAFSFPSPPASSLEFSSQATSLIRGATIRNWPNPVRDGFLGMSGDLIISSPFDIELWSSSRNRTRSSHLQYGCICDIFRQPLLRNIILTPGSLVLTKSVIWLILENRRYSETPTVLLDILHQWYILEKSFSPF